jgi:phage gp36-like protein
MFVEKTDLIKEIRLEELNQITRNDDTLITYSCDVAISEMKSYLYPTYNVNSIFSATGTSRHPLLLNFGIDIAIYILVATALPGQDLEDRRARYKRAIDWLKGVNKGDISTDLPVGDLVSPNNIKKGAVGEHKKRNNYF